MVFYSSLLLLLLLSSSIPLVPSSPDRTRQESRLCLNLETPLSNVGCVGSTLLNERGTFHVEFQHEWSKRPSTCIQTCQHVYPLSSLALVAKDRLENDLDCKCARAFVVKEEMLGPRAFCNETCVDNRKDKMDEGQEVECGGLHSFEDGQIEQFYSVYCIPMGNGSFPIYIDDEQDSQDTTTSTTTTTTITTTATTSTTTSITATTTTTTTASSGSTVWTTSPRSDELLEDILDSVEGARMASMFMVLLLLIIIALTLALATWTYFYVENTLGLERPSSIFYRRRRSSRTLTAETAVESYGATNKAFENVSDIFDEENNRNKYGDKEDEGSKDNDNNENRDNNDSLKDNKDNRNDF